MNRDLPYVFRGRIRIYCMSNWGEAKVLQKEIDGKISFCFPGHLHAGDDLLLQHPTPVGDDEWAVEFIMAHETSEEYREEQLRVIRNLEERGYLHVIALCTPDEVPKDEFGYVVVQPTEKVSKLESKHHK